MSERITEEDLTLRVDDGEEVITSEHIEVGPATGSTAVKGIFAPGNRKRLAFIAVAGFILVGAIIYSFMSFDPNAGAEQRGGGGSSNARTNVTDASPQNDSWVTAQERRRYNDEELARVQEENPTAHPLLEPVGEDQPYESKEEMPNPFEEETEKASPRKLSQAAGVDNRKERAGQNQTAFVDPAVIDDLIGTLIEAEGARQPALQSVSWSYAAPAESMPPESSELASDALNSADETQAGQGVCERPLVRAGEMFMATTDLALNSDVGGPVAVSIHNGPLRGSRLLGTFERKEKWLRINLNRAVTKDETLDVEAIALDLETTLNAVEGDLDTHFLYRYGWWGFGTTLRAVGRAAEIAADQQVVVSDGTVIQTTESTSQREARIALGELGTELGEVMRERINRPITVSLNVGDEIGVFFMNDVCSEMTATSRVRGQ